VLVGGGARSGKSSFAQRRLEERHDSGLYIATAEPGDEEMRARIAKHRADRGAGWTTLEEPLAVTEALKSEAVSYQCVLVDCLTLWLSNVLLHPGKEAEREIDRLTAVLDSWRGPDLALVTNEVGCGIVPENALARDYRDLAGRMNQRVAEAADEVYWTVFGQALRIKPSGGGS
jgi:adenosylcobinamide kinase/adenosylcobinamide-phosphate guanylyltransferase